MIKLTKTLIKNLVDINSINIWLKKQGIKSTKDLLWDYYEIYNYLIINNFLFKVSIIIDKLPENLNLEEIQDFINHNKILSLRKIKYNYTKIYDRIIDLDIFYKLTYFNGRNDWSEFSSIEQEQKFVEDHNITKSKDFIKNFSELYKYSRYTHQFLLLKFKDDIDDENLYNSIDDFQTLIYENDIKTCEEFENRYPNIYNKLVRLKYRSLLIFTQFNKHDLNWVQTIDDYREFIETSKITSRSDAVDMFGKEIRKKISEENWMDKIGLESSINDWSCIKTLEDLQNYIDNNDIKSYKEFRENFRGLYDLMIRNYWTKEDLIFESVPVDTSWITNIEVVQKYVDKMGYKNSHEFSNDRKHNGNTFYRKISSLGLAKLIKYSNPICRNLENLTTLEEAKEFIKNNDIKNSVDFHKRFGSEYNRLNRLNLLEKVRSYYTGYSSEFLSSWEETFYESLKNFLDEQNILYRLQSNVSISGLKDKGNMKVDLKLEINSNTFIFELQGPTHFFNIYNDDISCFINRRKHDIMKKRWSNKNNIKLFFFTYNKELLNKYSFPYYVYSKEKDLFSDLLNAIKLA